MTLSPLPLSPEVRALLDSERVIPPVPAPVRARALSRARSALLAGGMMSAAELPMAPKIRWGAPVAAACVGSVMLAAVAYQMGAQRHSIPTDPHATPIAQVVATSPAPSVPSPPRAAAAPALVSAPASHASRPSQADAGSNELRLLRLARTAISRQDFAAALVPIGEHAHRFRDGRLAEEREALRVRALVGLGRSEEARRAADLFKARFPRSVLLPAVHGMPPAVP